MKNKQGILLVLMVFALVAVGACAKKSVPAQPGMGGETPPYATSGMPGGGVGLDDAKWRELGITSEAEKKEFLDRAKAFENQDIYYDYDSYTLSEPAKKILDEKLAFMKRWPKVRVTVEGHCDERGTQEYNLALGERRAHAAAQYISSSMPGVKLNTVSYGKERPLSTGHDESSWAKNRRAHFVLNY